MKVAVIYANVNSYTLARRIAQLIQSALPIENTEVVLYRRAYPLTVAPPKEVRKWGALVRVYVDVDVTPDLEAWPTT